jgi:hypothetical protein
MKAETEYSSCIFLTKHELMRWVQIQGIMWIELGLTDMVHSTI